MHRHPSAIDRARDSAGPLAMKWLPQSTKFRAPHFCCLRQQSPRRPISGRTTVVCKPLWPR